MGLAVRSPASTRSLSSAELRQLWERGQQGPAIRGALENWTTLMARADDLGWLEGALRACGLSAEALAVQGHITRRCGTVQAWQALIKSVLHSGDPWWARELLQETGGSSRDLQALRIEVELALGDASQLITAWLRDHRDEAALESAVGWWVRSGRVDEAERLVGSAEGLMLWHARFAVWRNQPETAQALLKRLPSSPEVRCLEAVTAVQEGRLEKAESMLRALLDSEARVEVGSWLATVLRKQKRYAEAMDAAQAASMSSPTFNLAARLERELAYDYARVDAEHRRSTSTFARLLRSMGLRRVTKRIIGELEHAEVLYALGLNPEEPIDSLETLLERFGGNRTLNLTTYDSGRLTACPLPPDPRYLGASIQLVAWTRGVDAARALYRELSARVDGHPLFRIYQGELELWMGAYEEAERIFRVILGKTSKVLWAWIGLGASVMLQGRLREAQKIWEKGLAIMRFVGPTLYVYRGECYRLQGELAKARRELEVAVRDKPQRLSAWINLALLDGQCEGLERVERKCVEFAPLLMGELSGSTAERLEKVLEAMRGNRSSYRVSYHLWGRVWSRTT